MKNALFLLIIAFLLFLAIFFYWKQSQAESQLSMASERINSLEQQVRRFTHNQPPDTVLPTQSVQPELSPTPPVEPEEKIAPPPSAAFVDELGSLSDAEAQRLQKKGLKNPEADLKNDLLRKQKALLPAKGTVGGTMAVRDVRVLNDRHALAYFEDGHNGGYVLLRFAVENGTITWTKLDSYTL